MRPYLRERQFVSPEATSKRPKATAAFRGDTLRPVTLLEFTEAERAELEALAQLDPQQNYAALKAIALLAIEQGKELQKIASAMSLSRRALSDWRNDFRKFRLHSVRRTSRRGRAPITRDRLTQPILDATYNDLPPNGRNWTCRSLADHLKVSVAMVQRVWKAAGVDPQSLKHHTSKLPFRHDDRLRLLGCYFLGGRRAMVVEILQARTAPERLWRHEPVLVAATGVLVPRKTLTMRNQLKMQIDQQLCFLEEVERRAEANTKLQLITDSADTFNHMRVRRWLGRSGRFAVHHSSTTRGLLFDAEVTLRDFSQDHLVRSIQSNLSSLAEGGCPLLIAPIADAFSTSGSIINVPTFVPTNTT